MAKVKEWIGIGIDGKGSSSSKDKDKDKSAEEILKEMDSKAAQQEASRLSSARIREYRMDTEVRAKEAEKRLRDLGSEPAHMGDTGMITPWDIEAAKALSNLPQEEQTRVMSVLMMVKSQSKESATSLLPLIMSTMVQNPGRSKEQTAGSVIETVTAMQKFANEIKQQQPTQQKSSVSEVAELMTAMSKFFPQQQQPQDNPMNKLTIELLTKMIEKGTNTPQQPSFFDMLDQPTKIEAFKKIFGSGNESKEYLELRAKMMNDERQFKLEEKKFDADKELRIAQMKFEAEKSQALKKAFEGIVTAAASAMEEEAVAQAPGTAPAMARYPNPQEAAMAQAQSLIEYFKCEKCAMPLPLLRGTIKFVCPNCGETYEEKPPQQAQPQAQPQTQPQPLPNTAGGDAHPNVAGG